MLKQHECVICHEPVSEIGSYAKLSGVKRAHLTCHDRITSDAAYQRGRQAVLDEQDQAAKALAEVAERRAQQDAREVFDRLTRCHRCGVKCTTEPGNIERARACGEVRMLSGSTPGVCSQCVADEARARQGARGAVPAALTTPQAPKEEKREEVQKDRFELVDLD